MTMGRSGARSPTEIGGVVMPVADPAFGWQEALTAFAIITVAAFLVTWILTDRLRIPRAPYIPMLLAVTLGLGAGYLAWSGTSVSELLSSRLGWGLAAGLLAAGIVGRPGRLRCAGARVPGDGQRLRADPGPHRPARPVVAPRRRASAGDAPTDSALDLCRVRQRLPA